MLKNRYFFYQDKKVRTNSKLAQDHSITNNSQTTLHAPITHKQPFSHSKTLIRLFTQQKLSVDHSHYTIKQSQ
jgi:hypothetical protein